MTARDLLKAQRPLAARWLKLTVGLGLLGGVLIITQAWLLALVIDAVAFADAGLADVAALALAAARHLRAAAPPSGPRNRPASAPRRRSRSPARPGLPAHAGARPRVARRAAQRQPGRGPDPRHRRADPYYARYLPAMTLTLLIPLAILLVVLPLDWLSGLVMLVHSAADPAVHDPDRPGRGGRQPAQWKQLARMGAHFLDVIQGLTTLKLFNASRREAEVIARISDDYRHSTMQVLQARVPDLRGAGVLLDPRHRHRRRVHRLSALPAGPAAAGHAEPAGGELSSAASSCCCWRPSSTCPCAASAPITTAAWRPCASAERLVAILDTPLPAEPHLHLIMVRPKARRADGATARAVR
jgi:ABC-type multidrug transport system fused ATPase/permease subunit